MDFEDYVARKERSKTRKECYSNFVDLETCVTLTGLVWSGQVEPDDIILIDQSDADWLSGDDYE